MSVPDTEAAFLSLLGELFTAPTTLVRHRPPLEVPKQRERVYLLEQQGYSLGGGEQYRIESYRPRFSVEVWHPGDDSQGASDRRWEMIYEIDQALVEADFEGYRDSGSLLVDPRTVGYDKGYLAVAICTITAEEIRD